MILRLLVTNLQPATSSPDYGDDSNHFIYRYFIKG